MSALNSHFGILNVEEGMDSEDEKKPSSNSQINKTKKNKKKASSARKDINKLLEKFNNTSQDDVTMLAVSIENNLNSNSQFEDEMEIALKHSQELEKSKVHYKKNDDHPQRSEGRKNKNKHIITMSLREFTSGDVPQHIPKEEIHLEKAMPWDNETELAKSGFFSSAKAEKQYKANLEKRRQDEINLKLRQSEAETKLKEKQRKLVMAKEQEIVRLKDMENKLLEELTQVKKRNHQLNFMLKSPEMEGKLKLMSELEELKQFVGEMNNDVSERQKEIEREIKSNADLLNQIDHLKSIKQSK